VIDVELPQLPQLRPELVTLLIGVNDVVQSVPEAPYRGNVADILDALMRQVGASRVLVVTTPDYTVTPAGADYGDPATQAAAIRRNNAINTELAEARGIAVVDIYDLSLRAGEDRSLVASDGLHPSGAQYALWVERIAPVVAGIVARAAAG
jgi:lysophospholipase L1-like esterase